MKKRDYFFVMILLLIISISSAELTSDNYSIISEGTSSGGGDFDSDNFSTIAVSGFVSGEASSDNYTGQVGILYGVISGGNTAPTISLLTPSDGNSTFDRTPTFTYTGNDIDGDSFLYDINITKKGLSLCSDYNLEIENYSESNYTPINDLRCFDDNNDYYEWTVRACENETEDLLCSDWAPVRTINITSLIQISLLNDSIYFGNMIVNESKNTTDSSLDLMRVQNDGNSKINISVNASQLWSSISEDVSEYFQSKVRDYVGNASWANINWFQVPTISGFTIMASDLNYSSSLGIDLLLTVPPTESSGTKSSTINFQAELSEVYDAA